MISDRSIRDKIVWHYDLSDMPLCLSLSRGRSRLEVHCMCSLARDDGGPSDSEVLIATPSAGIWSFVRYTDM